MGAGRGVLGGDARLDLLSMILEAINTSFCPAHEKFHTVVFKGVRNISDTI